MNMEHVPGPATMGVGQHDEVETRLHGHWLLLARMLWIAIFVLTLVVFCANLLVSSYGLLITILIVTVTAAYFAVSLVLFWLKSSDRFILLTSLQLVLLGSVIIPGYPGALEHYGIWWVPIVFLEFLAWSAFSVLYLFPDGRFVPRWTRWLALGWVLIWLATNLPLSIPGAFYPWNWGSSPFLTLVQVAYFCSLMLALLYRYRRVATPVQRQQIKWIVFASTMAFFVESMAYPILSVLPSYVPAFGPSSLLFQLFVLISIVVPGPFPLSIGFALLRYRLWNIDIIINRTLIYGTLTASLALVYVGLIFALQSLLGVLTKQSNNDVAIVVSTLAIAALFHPLRRRIQAIIDRRFYRRKYDAAKTVAAFSTTLRTELDLEQLREELLAVVEETMQPSQVWLWLPPAKPARSPLPAWSSPPADSLTEEQRARQHAAPEA